MLDLYREAFKYVDDVGKDQKVKRLKKRKRYKLNT